MAGQQVALSDEHLLVLGVAVEADEVHAIEQRRGNGVGHVGGGDEHDLRQIELDLQVVVAERVVLRGVEHFQQRGRGVAAPAARADLVDLVEQYDRVHAAGLDDGAHDATRLTTHVCSAVAADLGLVAHATEGHAHEVAAHRLGDRFTEACLADTGRADQCHHRARRARVAVGDAAVGAQLAHRQELDDAILHVVEAVVVGVQLGAGTLELELVGCACGPRQLEHAVQPGAHPTVLRRLLAHPLQPFDLLGHQCGGLLR